MNTATSSPIPIVVCGAAGRMGRRIIALAAEDAGLELVAAVEAAGQTAVGRDAGELAGVVSNAPIQLRSYRIINRLGHLSTPSTIGN